MNIEPKQKDQIFMLMDCSNPYSFLNLCIIHNHATESSFCLETHSTGQINLVHKYKASLNKVK